MEGYARYVHDAIFNEIQQASIAFLWCFGRTIFVSRYNYTSLSYVYSFFSPSGNLPTPYPFWRDFVSNNRLPNLFYRFSGRSDDQYFSYAKNARRRKSPFPG